jgi:hypothetical protein
MHETGLVVGPLGSWPDGDLERACRLLEVTSHRLGDADLDLLDELAMFEGELARRRSSDV